MVKSLRGSGLRRGTMQHHVRKGWRGAPPKLVRLVGDRARLPVSRFTTADSSPPHRFPAWKARDWPSVAALFDVTPVGPFETQADQVVLDGLIIQFAWGTARRFERSASRTADGIDVVALNIMLEPSKIQIDGKLRAVGAGDAVLIDAAQPSIFELPTGHSIQLAFPRTLAASQLGPVSDLHGLIIPEARAAMLTTHLENIRAELADFLPIHGPRLARTIVDIIAITTDREYRATVQQDSSGASPTALVKQTIEENLGHPNLGVAWLTRRLKLSRSAIYRALEDEDGVEAYIRARRLEQVRRCLAEPTQTMGIGALAMHWGFCDASHLSRLFRSQFGSTPSAYRACAASNASAATSTKPVRALRAARARSADRATRAAIELRRRRRQSNNSGRG